MPNAGPQGNHRKSLAVKHHDGEPLTRVDLQYDLLYYLFNDSRAVFTDPYVTLRGEPAGSRVTFRDLYVNALVHSPRCSKVSRDKLLETPAFANEFAKISLLSNVGRINTTMAFFPEMRTALRTYHPVPSLQKTDGNLQDAPRIKNILKSCLLPTDLQDTPMTPADILARSRSGEVPPTTIVNLIFIITSHAAAISQAHFPAQIHFDILEFFSPIHISSESRARAFLWLLYHYHEAPSRNPFDDEASRKRPGVIPTLETLSDEEAALENVDTPEETEWGRKMTEQRRIFLATKDLLSADEGPGTSKPKDSSRRARGRGRGRASRTKQTRALAESSKPTRDPSPSGSIASIAPEERFEMSRGPFAQQAVRLPPILPPLPSPPLPPFNRAYHDTFLHPTRAPPEPYPQHYPSDPVQYHRTDGKFFGNGADARGLTLPPLHYVESYDDRTPPRRLPPLSIPPSPPLNRDDSPPTFSMPPDIEIDFPTGIHTQGTSRSMLEQAWHVVMRSDPLEEAEDEPDENTRLDLSLRLRIISRLRGKEPTPEPELRRRQAELHSSREGSPMSP